jgi:hypothetical protein
MSSPIVQPTAFNSAKISVSQPKLLSSGGKLAYLNYGDSRSLVMQTPSLPSSFGLSVYDKTNPPKYSIDLSLRGYEENPKVKAFYEAMKKLDEYMIDYGVKNSKLLFKGEKSREAILERYTPIVKIPVDKEGNVKPYPPNIKLKLMKQRDSDEFECQFYDEKSKSDPNAKPIKDVPVEELLVKRVEVTALIQCTGVWITDKAFGVSWKAVQMRLDSVPQGIKGYGFQNDGDDHEDAPEFKSSAPAFASEFSSKPAKKPVVEDPESSDSEEEEVAPAPVPPAPKAVETTLEEDSEEEEVAPAPVPKKTVVTKKKVVANIKK